MPRICPEERAAWRAWLRANYEVSASVWLVIWRKTAGRSIFRYADADAVSEALAFGWVDSQGDKVDETRTMLYFAARAYLWNGPRRTAL